MIPTDLIPSILGVIPSPLKAYVRLTTPSSPARDAELTRELELGLARFMAGGIVSPTMASRPPLSGRHTTIATAQGLLVPIVTLSRPAASWADQPPVWIQIIAQAEMWLHSHTRCQIGVFDSSGYHSGWLVAAEPQQRAIMEAAEEMARRVAEGKPPAPDAGDLDAVKAVFPTDHEGEIRLTREHGVQLDRLRLLRQRANALVKRASGIEARLRYAIGGHRLGVLPDGRRVKLAVAGRGRRLTVGR